jgi:subtilisin family serine protease
MRRIACLVVGVVLLAATVPVAARGASPDGPGVRRIGAPISLSNAAGAPPPDGAPAAMHTVIVTMRSQADLSSVPGAGSAVGRRGLVRALQAHAAADQRALLRYLDRERTRGGVAAVESFWVFNGLSVTARPDVAAAIAARADVATVEADDINVVPLAAAPSARPGAAGGPPLAPAGPVEPNIAAVNAPGLWSLGDTGQGIVVASLDSGVDAAHPDLAARWRGGTNSWFDPYGQHPTAPVDMTGHGTGTMGVMVGGDAGGAAIGMAPGATWIAAKIFNDAGSGTATAIHAAFQWVLDPDGDPATDDAPDVLNNSWSYGSIGCNLAFQLDLQSIRAAGILPVFAGGNFGPGASSSVSPANYPESFAVGSVDGTGLVDGTSSRGPSACGEASTAYPEVVAPGVAVRTADRYGLYQVATGTSLAAPHAAGALALLLAAHPGLTAEQQAAALAAGAVDLGPIGPDNTYGAGRLDVLAAHEWLVANPPPPPPPPAPSVTAIVPSSGTTTGGTTVTIMGTGFATAAGSTSVAFGGVAGTGVTCATTTSCIAVSPAAPAGTVDVRVTVGGQASAVTASDQFTYLAPAAPVTDPVAVPALAKGYGYWVTVTSTAAGPVSATWTRSAAVQGTLAIYAGNPFVGLANPVKKSPPSGALVISSGKRKAFGIATSSRPPGTYTVYFYAGAAVGASTGSVATWR